MDGKNTEVVVKDGENAAELKCSTKTLQHQIDAGSDAITVAQWANQPKLLEKAV